MRDKSTIVELAHALARNTHWLTVFALSKRCSYLAKGQAIGSDLTNRHNVEKHAKLENCERRILQQLSSNPKWEHFAVLPLGWWTEENSKTHLFIGDYKPLVAFRVRFAQLLRNWGDTVQVKCCKSECCLTVRDSMEETFALYRCGSLVSKKVGTTSVQKILPDLLCTVAICIKHCQEL